MQVHFLTAFALPICKRNDKHEPIFTKGKQEDIIKWIMTGMPLIWTKRKMFKLIKKMSLIKIKKYFFTKLKYFTEKY